MAKGRDDLRLALGWVDHLKTRRLIDEVGERAALCLLRLWAYAAENHPDGVLSSQEDVELAAGWRGRRGVLLEALVRLRWLEADGVTLHDWQEEQPWIAGRARRVASAKANAAARWHKGGNADTASPQCGPHSGSDDSAMPNCKNGNAPSPSPSPSPIPTPSPTRTPEARAPDPEVGFSATPTSPKVDPPTGRSVRLPDEPQEAPGGPQEAQAAAAHRLELAIGCGFKQALGVVQGLDVAGAPLPWIEARIAASNGTSPAPWVWAREAKQAWAVESGAQRPFRPFLPLDRITS